jgi:GH15 family glucan-1,4-alpha-glucosidase
MAGRVWAEKRSVGSVDSAAGLAPLPPAPEGVRSGRMPHAPIDRYGVIGDCDTVALVGTDGSIDFMCFPYFDSPSIFARLLDEEKGGSFQLHPSLAGARQKQLYLPDTNILFTRFLPASTMPARPTA